MPDFPSIIDAHHMSRGMILFTVTQDDTVIASQKCSIGNDEARKKIAAAWEGTEQLFNNGSTMGATEIAMELERAECVLIQRELDDQFAADAAQDAGDDAPEVETSTESQCPKAPRASQADMLVGLASTACQFFHTPGTREAYARFSVGGHFETWPVRSTGFREWLCRLFFEENEKTPSSQPVSDCMNVLCGKATYDCGEYEVSIRVGEHAGCIYLDLSNDTWDCVEISRDGWKIVKNGDVPVRFARRRGMLAIPDPQRGGSIDDLKPFVNVGSEDGWILFVSFVIAALQPRGPYPILPLSGEQGSSKTVLCKIVRLLIDPNEAPVRRLPKNEQDLAIAASNSHLAAYDNLSHIPPDIADALCCLASGGGFATRKLYTDSDEMIFSGARPILLNGIADVATRSDLLDRSIPLNLPTIPETSRREEEVIYAEFKLVSPAILGALLDAVSMGLRNRATTKLDCLPRMADFAKLIVAAEPALPWEPGEFLKAYSGNRDESHHSAVESQLIGPPILKFLQDHPEWLGQAHELLTALEDDQYASRKLRDKKGWPGSGRKMRSLLERIGPNLRALGYSVEFGIIGPRPAKARLIRLALADGTAKPQSPPGSSGQGDSSDLFAEAQHAAPSQDSPIDAQREEPWDALTVCETCGEPICWGEVESDSGSSGDRRSIVLDEDSMMPHRCKEVVKKDKVPF